MRYGDMINEMQRLVPYKRKIWKFCYVILLPLQDNVIKVYSNGNIENFSAKVHDILADDWGEYE